MDWILEMIWGHGMGEHGGAWVSMADSECMILCNGVYKMGYENGEGRMPIMINVHRTVRAL